MTNFTRTQIRKLTEILTGSTAGRLADKGKEIARLEAAAKAAGVKPAAYNGMSFDAAVAFLEEWTTPAEESAMLKRAADVAPGSGGPGLARLRKHKKYDEITSQTVAEAEAVTRGEDPFAKGKKRGAAAKPNAKATAKTTRAKINPDQIIDSIVDNPKRDGTKAHKIFSLYRNGMTVAAFIKAVEKAGYPASQARADLSWDTRKGFIRVREAVTS